MKAERDLHSQPNATVCGGYTFPIGDLEEREDIPDPAFRDNKWEFHSFLGNVLGRAVKLRVLVNPFRGRLGLMTGIPGVSDDRSLHRHLIASFREHLLSNDRIKTLGTHLLLLPDGRSALGVSTVQQGEKTADEKIECNIGRTYCIPLRPDTRCRACGNLLNFFTNIDSALPDDDIMAACANPECRYAESWPLWEQNAVGEIEFSFAMIYWLDNIDLEFCRQRLVEMTPVMESLTLRVARNWTSRLLEWQAVVIRLIIFLAMLEGFRYSQIALDLDWKQRLWVAGIGFSAVELTLTVLLPSLRRRIMEMFYGHKMWLPLGTWFPRWWNVLKGSVWESFMVASGGIFFVGVGLVAAIASPRVVPVWAVGILGAATSVLGASVRHIASTHSLPVRNSAGGRAS